VSSDQIWIGQDGQQYGPYTEADIRQWLKDGKLAADALAWREGMAEWTPLSTLFPPEPIGSVPPPFAGRAAPPPFANAHANVADQASIPMPPSLHWALVWLFAIFSFGIFALVWPFIQASWVRKIDARSNAMLMLGLAIGCVVIGYPLYFAGLMELPHGGGSGMLGFGGLLMFGYWVFFIVAYFSMAGSMRDKLASRALPLEIGGVTLFFFTMYYLQAQLSWIARWKRTGQTEPRASKGVFWAIFLLVPFVLGIFAAISIPAYQDYVIRSQVSQGLVMADRAKTAMTEYYLRQQKLPANNAAAGLPSSESVAGKYVSSVDIADGKITVAFDSTSTNLRIRPDVLVISAQANGGQIVWQCGAEGTTVPQQFLPTSCRH
jgi:Tfp pilus assembly major pilin PilA